jgi:hypothetical protein
VIDNNPLDFDLRVDFFRQSDDRVITAFTLQTENKELQFSDNGGLQTARMNIFGRIMAVSGKRSGIFEDSVTTNATTAELVEARDRKSIYQKAVALTPGTYKVDVVVRDVGTGNKGIRSIGFTVPRYEETKLATSTLDSGFDASHDDRTRHRRQFRHRLGKSHSESFRRLQKRSGCRRLSASLQYGN